MEIHVIAALACFLALVGALLATVTWQRQVRLERRQAHVEHEVGVDEEERGRVDEHGPVKRKVTETLRARVAGVERKVAALDRRTLRQR